MEREYRPTMGFKELIVKENIMDITGYPVSDLSDCRLLHDLGIQESQVRQILLNVSYNLRQEPVENPIFAHKIKTVGDILFYFYAPAERYKYFEKIILEAKHCAGDFIQKSMHPKAQLSDMLRDENETKVVFEEIQLMTGRNYWGRAQEALKRGEMKTVGEFITFLSNPENGILEKKVKASTSFWENILGLTKKTERVKG